MGGRSFIIGANNNPGVYIMGARWKQWVNGGNLVGAAYSNAILSPAGDKIAMAFVSRSGNERSLLVCYECRWHRNETGGSGAPSNSAYGIRLLPDYRGLAPPDRLMAPK